MTVSEREVRETILSTIDLSKAISFNQGIREGLRTVQTIARMYGENHKLLNPATPEELKAWADAEILKLESLIKK